LGQLLSVWSETEQTEKSDKIWIFDQHVHHWIRRSSKGKKSALNKLLIEMHYLLVFRKYYRFFGSNFGSLWFNIHFKVNESKILKCELVVVDGFNSPWPLIWQINELQYRGHFPKFSGPKESIWYKTNILSHRVDLKWFRVSHRVLKAILLSIHALVSSVWRFILWDWSVERKWPFCTCLKELLEKTCFR
jgi:hypothetical protein